MNRSALLWGVALSAMSLFMVPQALAATPGELVSDALTAPEMTLTADANLTLKKGGEMDLPFDVTVDIYEEGGKSGDQFSASANANIMLRNIEDGDPFLTDLNWIDVNMAFDEIYQDNGTFFLRFRDFAMNTDSQMVQDFLNAFNELAKFPADKWMKFSTSELAQVMRDLGLDDLDSQELEQALVMLSGYSLDKVMMAYGDFLDDLIASGFLKVEMVNNDGALRRARNGGLVHRITFAEEMDANGARIMRDSLAKFLSSFFPTLEDDITEDLMREDPASMVTDLNQFLAMASLVDFQILLAESNGMLDELVVQADVSNLGFPLSFNETVSFDYSAGYVMELPTDSAEIVDFTKILKGFMTMATGVQHSMGYYDDYGYEEMMYDETSDWQDWEDWESEEYAPMVYGFNPEMEFNRIVKSCGRNRQCLEVRLTRFSDDLKAEWETGFMSNTEYSMYREKVWETLHP